MLRMLKAQHIRNLLRIQVRIKQGVLCYFRYLDLDQFIRSLAGFRLHQIAKIVGRKANFFGKIFHGGQPLRTCRAGIPILVQQLLETDKDIVVQHFASDKLAFIEAHAVVEQHLDIGDYQRFGKLVDGMLQFMGYLAQIILHDGAFIC